MLRMDDREFIKTCTLNKYFSEICKDDYLFKRKLELSYPDTITVESLQKYKDVEEIASWKQYYSNVVKTVGLLKEKWNLIYTKGNPFTQMGILINTGGLRSVVLYYGVTRGEIDLVRYAVKDGAKITSSVLNMAARLQNITILKFLIEHGGNVNEIDKGSQEAIEYLKKLKMDK